jgi:hypothetical protein
MGPSVYGIPTRRNRYIRVPKTAFLCYIGGPRAHKVTWLGANIFFF